jgi:hypothetical protein
MIELRWIVRNTGKVFPGDIEAGESDIPQTEQVLQVRQRIHVFSDSGQSLEWSDWQDVPLVREGE